MGRQSVQTVVDTFSERIFPGLSQIPQEFSFVSGQSDIGMQLYVTIKSSVVSYNLDFIFKLILISNFISL